MEALQRALFRLASAVRSAPVSAVVAVLGLASVILLILTEFSTIVSIDVLTAGTCEEIADPAARDACQTSGFEQHGGALILLALVVAVMTFGAARRASRPAAVALIGIGVVVLLVWLLRDLPKIGDTGLVGIEYEQAKASAASGFYFELAGGVLAVLAGVAALLAGRGGAPPPEEPRRRARPAAAG